MANNIHIVPTDKPRTYKGGKISTFTAVSSMMPTETVYNIYITSDEEIKEGDWYFDIRLDSIFQCESERHSFDLNNQRDIEKIILTTDIDLIKDRVQEIGDEFLEWFVDYPSCKNVEVEREKLIIRGESDYFNYDDGKKLNVNVGNYKIIIPKLYKSTKR